MKLSKGFSMIELMIIIVLLALIILSVSKIFVSTSSSKGTIDTTGEDSAKISAINFVDMVEKQIVIDQLQSDDSFKIIKGYTGNEVELSLDDLKDVNIKGTKPYMVQLTINREGQVIKGFMSIQIENDCFDITLSNSRNIDSIKNVICTN